jgi:protease IV
MKYLKMSLILLIIVSCVSYAQTGFSTFYSRNDFLLTSSGSMKYGLYGYDNPALLTYIHQPDIMFNWSDATGHWNDFNRWGLFTVIPNFGFGLIHQKYLGKSVTDYHLAAGFGNKSMSFGIGYGWSGGDIEYFQRRKLLTVGTLLRPSLYFSLGATGTFSANDRHEGAIDLGIRPLGNELLTLFTDYAIENKQNLKHGGWSYGAALEFLPGIRITGRYFNTHTFTTGIQVSFGRIGVSTQAHYDKDSKHSYNTYGIRMGAYDRTIVGTKVFPEKKYVELNLNGPIKYQRFKLFDESNTLADLLATIKAAKEDPTVNGIAINTSGMTANKEMLWELREQLKEFKASGKKVVVFIDLPNIDVYHFASVADKIVMDPTGTLTLEGYIMGRTYLKGTLAKLGIGYDEWRFFKYKSAMENLSRDKMSDADREQRQKLVDDYYKLAKSDVCESRKISAEQFDRYVNDVVIFLAEDAVKEGLVDTVGRWEAVKEMVKKLEGEEKCMVGAGALAKFHLPYDNYWGEPPRIAVVYALGACAMDEGITARSLVKTVEAVTNDPKVKAVVLRVDSPGGDGMASDYIAEALKKCKEKKPVIVSQGYVAASGGYWLSMYADTIVAAPNTITGSVGVIGGWMYNKGLKDTLGMTTDFVKVGKHADLGFGFTLPFIGLGIPDRNMTEEERSKAELAIKTMYKEFVNKVAVGRKKKFDDIEPIAQGRVWSGYDGRQNGLVDVLGGLETAIQIARDRAGIPHEQDVNIVEYPEKGWIDMSFLQPKLFGVRVEDDPTLNYVKFRLQHNGQPMPMLPIDETEFGQRE